MAKTTQKATLSLSYSLSAIRTVNFRQDTPKKKFNIKEVLIDYNIAPDIKYNIEKNHVLINLVVTGTIKETDENILTLSTNFFFTVDNLKSFLKKNEEEKYEFINSNNEIILVTFIGISVSTMRGIILERTRGTLFESRLLPLINPTVFFKDMKIITKK